MSKTDATEHFSSKEVTIKRDAGDDGVGSIKEQRDARLAGIEQDKKDKDKPRRDWMLTGKGKPPDDFELISNKATVERYTDQTDAPQSTEELSESAREKWLRTGELPEAKPNGKAAEKQQAEGNADTKFTPEQIDKNLDKEIFAEIGKRRDWWNEEGHAEAHKTMPERTVAAIQGLSAEEKNVIANSPTRTMQLDAELDRFLGHALARAKNLGKLHLELARDPGLLKRMNDDWVKTANKPKERWATEQSIRYVLAVIDKRGASAGGSKANGAGGERKLTKAGRPPLEAGGGSSSPEDDGSSDAAWKRKDLSPEERGELYRTRKNEEDRARRRKRARAN